ncbi:MAG TPA: SDR family NAD(P)-dependent oxidoreductase, partial [Thermoanaerobaculia bacterium]|nr:SDR family NAD(P)-dependent oxidoreductase [Thermoanaerobaculia bacterium]
MSDYVIRHAAEADLDRLCELEELCWQHTRTSREQLRSRLLRYPEGQLVLEKDAQVLGVIYSQRIADADALTTRTAADVHELHDPSGSVIQLLAVNLDPRVQNAGYGDQLLEHMLQRCSVMAGIDRVVGVTLCKRFDGSTPFDAYTRREGSSQDPVLAFHWAHGAEVVKAIPGYRPEDRANQSNGVLVAYDIRNRPQRRQLTAGAEAAALDREQIARFVEGEAARLLGIGESELDVDRPVMEMGLDSADLLKLQRLCEERFAIQLQAGFFFEHGSIRKVIDHLAGKRAPAVREDRDRVAAGDIAIVGLACKLPGGIETPDDLWRVLAGGECVIGSFPAERRGWPSAADYPGIDQGGFVADADAFDAAFFRISPAEAQVTDPQQRMLMQLAWSCLEDAGILPAALKGSNTGVFVGASNCDYSRLVQEAGVEVEAYNGVGSSLAILANRVSYFFDLSGPSLVVDTACSSSLVALHAAVQSLRSGECAAALAGGVNFICHPDLSVAYHKAGMLAPDGRCKVFDASADGYVRSEGAVVLLLKPLRAAVAEGNRIHAVIRGSATNHGGLAGGLTVPNPQKQKELLIAAWKDAGVAAQELSYIEAHGTGTSLGDPIEVEGIQAAYAELGSCAIGSVKSNLGHLESAAGITGLLKVVLSLRHRQLPASVHFARLNPKISLDGTPLTIQDHLRQWDEDRPRVAGVSSFGSGGANAHVVVEEYPASASISEPDDEYLFVLSAANDDRLREYARSVLAWLERGANFADAIFTWQTGRTAMKQRLAIKAKDRFELRDRLMRWLAGDGDAADVWSGHAGQKDATLARMWQTKSGRQLIDHALAERDIDALATLWTAGTEIDWRKYYESPRQPASVPTYPFAKDRHWIEAAARVVPTAVMHPLLHVNTSDLRQQSYSATFTGEEFFLADHQVRADGRSVQKVLPAVAYLEMTRAAIERALPAWPESTLLELRNTVWVQPIVVTGAKQIRMALSADDDGQLDYEIYSEEGEQRIVHCQGRAVLSAATASVKHDLPQLERTIGPAVAEPDAAYAAWARMGLVYGPSFRTITAIHHGSGQSLVRLRMRTGEAEYVLHPSMMDGAVQAAVGFVDGWSALAGGPHLPFALESLRIISPCTREMAAWVRYAAGSHDSVVKLDIDLCDEQGNVCVELRGFSSRAVSQTTAGSLLAVPVWEPRELDRGARIDYAQHYVERLPLSAEGSIAQRYGADAVACFERIQAILRGKPEGKVLFQIAVAGDEEQALLAGLSGLLKTAALENPRFTGQLILAPAELERILEEERSHGQDSLIRYRHGTREVLRWQEVATDADTIAFKNDGVYLITGGFGALGQLFANEIRDRAPGAQVVLTGRRQVDLEDADQVRRLIASIKEEHGRLTGILHCAGMIADGFILTKDSARFRDVLAPKVVGTYNLDQATRDVELDFFVLFSSVNGALGNVGQADYAAANAFLDQFAAYRNRQVAAGERHGRTRSIDWPLWQDGGMKMDAASLELLHRATGMQPMQTATGMQAFHRILALPHDQVLVMEGDPARMRRTLMPASAKPVVERPTAVALEPDTLAEKTEEYLRRQFSSVLKLPAHDIDPRAALKDYGIDSMVAMKLTNRLEETFGSLSKTLFFEYQTVRELTAYFVDQYASQLGAMFAVAVQTPRPVAPPPARRFLAARSVPPTPRTESDPIAIVGLSGRYPEAPDVDAYWENLRGGRDCIIEVPRERWDWRKYYSEDRTRGGRHYSKWGGFISGVDEFDPLFFNIAPKEAKYIDPQERLFLQHAWMAVEDAGYTRAALPGEVGVYAGVMWSEYQLFGTAANAEELRMGFAGNLASIANRVSYALNLHGPSMTLDTMCSSSLTAIHVACEDLKHGRTGLAIAGGVNVSVHPHKYLMLSVGQFISSDGHCQSFGEGGDGYIPGEGVGVVVLKRLSDAERDGDHIYGIIRGSALTHGGRTNGYTVPNPQAQAGAISRALSEARVDARHVSYVEAHGTGTKLGDPIEIAALGKAFDPYTKDTGFCLIGSAKSNIGHCESAAGIAGLTKVLLQMQHRQIVPSLHSEQLNPHIDFDRGPFIVNQSLKAWEQPVIDGRTLPRVAGLSSFGAGGSNAHMIVEEYQTPVRQPAAAANVVILLSARTPEQLRQKAVELLAFVRARRDAIDLVAIAYTLQLGREPMDERLGFAASSVDELLRKLEAFVAGEPEELHQGQAKRNNDALSLFSTDADLREAVDKWIAHGKLSRLVELWVKGLEVDWSRLYGEDRPRRISLPTYPFAKERYWIDVKPATAPRARIARMNRAGVARRRPRLPDETVATVTAVTVPERKEIALQSPTPRKKPAAIALAAPDAVDAPAVRTISRPAVRLAEDAFAAASPVRLYDGGDGTFAIEIAASRTTDMIVRVLQALERAQQEPAIKALMLSGIEHCFASGGRSAYDEAVGEKLFQRLASFPYPVIAALPGDVIGAGFLAAALCDLMVCSEDALYGYRDADLHPTPAVAALFEERFGDTQFLSSSWTGRELRARGWTCPVLPWAEVEAHARGLASTLATKSRDALRLLKEHLNRRVAELVDGLAPVDAAAGEIPLAADDDPGADLEQLIRAEQAYEALAAAPTVIPLQSTVVTATAHPEGIVVVKLEDREAKNMFSDALVAGVAEAFDHIRQSSAYKVVVLTGYDSYFASGGTRETLLAIQQGSAKFTDVKVFQAALDCELPVIAAMQGHGIGAGWSMGMFADVVLLSDESRYVSPYMDYGFTPGAGATFILAEKMGQDLARESLLTAREYSGRELKERSVRLRVLPRAEVVPKAMSLARRIARAPRQKLIGIKERSASPIRQQLGEVYRRELAMHEQTFVGRADTLARIEDRFRQEARLEVAAPRPAVAGDALGDVSGTLKALLAHELQVRESDVRDDAQFVDLGLDSISGVTWMRKINAKYKTSIEATKIYAYPTLAQLSRHVQEEAA